MGTGYHAGAAFEASCKFHRYLVLVLVECVQMPGTDRQAMPCTAFRPTDAMINDYMAFFVCLKCIEGEFFVYFHVCPCLNIFYTIELEKPFHAQHSGCLQSVPYCFAEAFFGVLVEPHQLFEKIGEGLRVIGKQ